MSDIRQEISQRLIALIKNGVIPWRKPWSADPNASGTPINVTSKKTYKGVNTLLLTATGLQRGYNCKWWGTSKQWEKLGGTIKPKPDEFNSDEWGTKIVFYLPFNRIVNSGGGQKNQTSFFLKTSILYNLEQVDGDNKKLNKFRLLEQEQLPEPLPDYQNAQRVIDATQAEIQFGGNDAKYYFPEPYESWPKHTSGDYITMPYQRQYVDIDSFYDTMFHELAHWSELRVGWNRKKTGNTYAMGELIAEISACLLAAELRLPASQDLTNHGNYIAEWLEKMGEDHNFIFKAAAAAHKTVKFILSFSQEQATL
jgi:antirestriction protein ArdC